MALRRRRVLRALGAAFAAAAGPFAAAPARGQASASGFPSRPVRIIVPYGAGSTTDLTARVLAPRMAQKLGQPVVIENRAGATGIIGSELVARAAPDGYTLVLGSVASHGTLQSLVPNLPYNVLRDFTPIGLATAPPAIVVVHPSVPATNLKELAAYSRTLPDGLTYASSGVGGSGHLATELLAIRSGAKLVHVPYKEANRAVTDVIAGHAKLMIYYSPVVPHIRSGKLRGLALLAERRASFAPEIPTAIEQGVPVVAAGWAGLFGPAGMPDPIRDALFDALKEALEDAPVRTQLAEQGSDPIVMRPTEFRSFVEQEIGKWGEVVKTSGVKME